MKTIIFSVTVCLLGLIYSSTATAQATQTRNAETKPSVGQPAKAGKNAEEATPANTSPADYQSPSAPSKESVPLPSGGVGGEGNPAASPAPATVKPAVAKPVHKTVESGNNLAPQQRIILHEGMRDTATVKRPK